jgi:hypothetical protein
MSKVIILAFAQIAVVTSTFALTADAASKPNYAIEISQEIHLKLVVYDTETEEIVRWVS